MHAVNEFLHGPPTVDWNENTVSLFSCATFARLKKKNNPRVLCILTCMWLFSFHKHFLFWENSWRTTLVCMWKPYKNIPLLFCNQIFLCRIKGEGVFSTLQREIYWQSLSHSHTHIPKNKIIHYYYWEIGIWKWVSLCVWERAKTVLARSRYDTVNLRIQSCSVVTCDRWRPLHLAFFKHKEKMKLF